MNSSLASVELPNPGRLPPTTKTLPLWETTPASPREVGIGAAVDQVLLEMLYTSFVVRPSGATPSHPPMAYRLLPTMPATRLARAVGIGAAELQVLVVGL